MDATHTGHRSFFLVLVVFLVNAFLAISAISGLLSLVDDAVLNSPMDGAMFALRTQFGVLAFVLSLLALAAVILVPHLPRLVLLPPVLVFIWQVFGAPGIEWSISDRKTWVTLDALALGSVAFAFLLNRMTTGHWFLAASRLPFRDGLVFRTLVTMPIAAIAVAVVAVGAVLAAVPVFIEQQSHGYLHFASKGLEVRETILRKGDATVHLVGMVHIGEPAFYRNLYDSIPQDALILAEGVTDKAGRMKAKPSYENAARGLGLESQGEFQRLLAGSKHPVEPATPLAATPAPKSGPTVVFADIDVADLSPTTLKFLEQVGTIFQSPTLSGAISRYFEVATKFKEDEINNVMEEIVKKRNNKVLSEFDRYSGQYKNIYIPWGALHMPDLEDKLKQRGFQIESQRMLAIARYQTIIDALTGQKMKSESSIAPLGLASVATR